jgi:hypothetical protein
MRPCCLLAAGAWAASVAGSWLHAPHAPPRPTPPPPPPCGGLAATIKAAVGQQPSHCCALMGQHATRSPLLASSSSVEALLLLLLACLAATARATFAVPVVTAVSRSSFAVEGDTEPLLVSGFGVAATGPGAPPPRCRITPLAGESGFVHVSGFLSDPRSEIYFNASVLHANTTCPVACYLARGIMHPCCFATLRCDAPPAVLAPGPGLLSVRNNVGYSTTALHVDYSFLVDVALDRRPFISERTGRLLLRFNASLIGEWDENVTVRAWLPDLPPAASAGWNRTIRWPPLAADGGREVLELPFSQALPATVNADLQVEIGWPGGRTTTAWRRFMRAPHAAAVPPTSRLVQAVAATGQHTAPVEPVQVDHAHRGILVNGSAFIGSGWYVDGNDEAAWKKNLTAMSFAITMQARVGDNQVMPYGLSTHFSPSEQWAFMDEMAGLGVKVIYPLAPAIPAPGAGACDACTRRHPPRQHSNHPRFPWQRCYCSSLARQLTGIVQMTRRLDLWECYSTERLDRPLAWRISCQLTQCVRACVRACVQGRRR